MIQVNLVPDVKQELLRAQTQRNFIISIAILLSISAAVVILLVAGYVYGAQTLLMANSNKTIDTEYAKLTSVEDLDKMLTIQSQLSQVSVHNQDKRITSRMYDMLNVVVPDNPHNVKISSMAVAPSGENALSGGTEEVSADSGALVTIEGQTVGSYASLEVFEKMIAAAVIEYKVAEGSTGQGDLNCGDSAFQCKYLAVGGGDRSTAVKVSEMSFGEDQNGSKTLYFKLSFSVVPELLSNTISDVRVKIGKDGNVTDSYIGVPRAIFEERTDGGN